MAQGNAGAMEASVRRLPQECSINRLYYAVRFPVYAPMIAGRGMISSMRRDARTTPTLTMFVQPGLAPCRKKGTAYPQGSLHALAQVEGSTGVRVLLRNLSLLLSASPFAHTHLL